MKNIKLPDITLTQVVAAVTWVIGQAVAMGLVDNNNEEYILQIVVTIITAAWLVGDSIIRNGRAKIAAAEINSGKAQVSDKNTIVG